MFEALHDEFKTVLVDYSKLTDTQYLSVFLAEWFSFMRGVLTVCLLVNHFNYDLGCFSAREEDAKGETESNGNCLPYFERH